MVELRRSGYHITSVVSLPAGGTNRELRAGVKKANGSAPAWRPLSCFTPAKSIADERNPHE